MPDPCLLRWVRRKRENEERPSMKLHVLASACLIMATCTFDLNSVPRPGGDGGIDAPVDAPVQADARADGGACLTGCWDGTSCQLGNTPSACGMGGDMCMVCDDGNICTTDTCDPTTHMCKHAAVPGCCNGDGDCNDAMVCTADSCNMTTHTCAHASIPNCCDAPSGTGCPGLGSHYLCCSNVCEYDGDCPCCCAGTCAGCSGGGNSCFRTFCGCP